MFEHVFFKNEFEQVDIKGDVHEKFSYQYKYSPNFKMVQMVWNLVCWVHLGANGRIPSFVPNGGHLEAMEDKVSN